jgi:spore coat protein U-like protein
MELSAVPRPSILFAALACLALAATPRAANPATTVTATFTVSTDVVTSCNVSATPLSFGSYNASATSNSTSVVTVACSNTVPYNVGLDAGTGTGATVTSRSMTGPTGALPLHYSLFQDSARTINWGDTVGTDTVAGTGNGSGQTLTVYGQVPAGQGNRPGTYNDTITVTVTY